MSNKVRGKVALQSGDATYELSFSVNALCSLEDATGLSSQEVFAQLGEQIDNDKLQMRLVRKIFKCALIDAIPDIDEKIAGEIMDKATIKVAVQKLTEAIISAHPEKEGGTENPPAVKK